MFICIFLGFMCYVIEDRMRALKCCLNRPFSSFLRRGIIILEAMGVVGCSNIHDICYLLVIDSKLF